jgi:hypothetical protein
MRRAWRRWINFAHVIGNIQLIIMLSLVYWTLLLLVAIPFRLFADPLTLRPPESAPWVKRHPVSHSLENMRRQG